MNNSLKTGSVVEIYRVKAEAIDLCGRLITEDGENFHGWGTVQFPDGKILHFSSPSEEMSIAKTKMKSACRVIAAFYGADLIHEKLESGFIENPLLN